MQDRSYAIAIVVVLAICCIGMYVAVSGYMNSNPSLSSAGSATPPVASTLVVILLNTETPVPPPTSDTALGVPTNPLAQSPLGAFQTITSSITVTVGRGTPSPTARSTGAILPQPPALPQPPPQPPVVVTNVPQLPAGCTTQFCARSGPPDASIGPGGQACPRNYIFGRVVDLAGQGIPDRTIRFTGPSGEVGTIPTKNSPDPRGSFNLPTGQPGTTYTLWLLDSAGGRISPQVSVTTQAYSGAGQCPTRIDFYQQR